MIFGELYGVDRSIIFYHDNTKERKHEKFKMFVFRVFFISCFRDENGFINLTLI